MALSRGGSEARRPNFCDAIGKIRAQPIQYKQKFASLITYIMLISIPQLSMYIVSSVMLKRLRSRGSFNSISNRVHFVRHDPPDRLRASKDSTPQR
jgi:hypothetical protein